MAPRTDDDRTITAAGLARLLSNGTFPTRVDKVPAGVAHEAVHRGVDPAARRRGRLKIEDPIKKYVADAPAAWDRITIATFRDKPVNVPAVLKKALVRLR